MEDDPKTVARALLGQRLVRIRRGRRLAGTIVEVEAYLGSRDPAAHTFGGRRTPRNESMYLPGGHAYVYFTYGAHFCLNVVCGAKGVGVAVLIRALEPTEGLEAMFRLRSKSADRRARPLIATDLCSGPGKLTQALGIDRRLDGIDLRTCSDLFIERLHTTPLDSKLIGTSPRIGLNPQIHWPTGWADRRLRYFLRGNPHVSG
jgi:DNA-3-methyladenine glycosylase